MVGLDGKLTISGLGARGHARDELFKLGEELLLVVDGNADDVRAGDDRAVDVDGVAGIGHQHGVARVEDGQAEVGDALLGADGDDGLGVGVEIDVVARLVPVADGLAQAGNAAGDRVAMRGRLERRLDQLVDDVLGRGAVGVAHAEVDDVFAAAAGGHLHFAGDVEDVGGQALNARKLFHDDSSVKPVASCQWSVASGQLSVVSSQFAVGGEQNRKRSSRSDG